MGDEGPTREKRGKSNPLNPVVLFALLMGLLLGVVFLSIPPALSELKAIYRASYTEISVLVSSLLWSHAAVQIPAGMIADRWGIRRTLLMSLMCIGVGNAIPGFLPELGLAIVGRAISGVGTGLSFVTVMKMIALHAPGGRTGSYQAFFAGFFSLGSILAYLAIPTLIRYAWNCSYLVPALWSVPLAAYLMRLPLKASAPSSPPSVPLGHVLRIPLGWILGVYHAISYGSMLSLGNWIPSLLAEVSGDTATQLAWGGALVMLVSGLGRLSGGFVLLRCSPLLIANASMAIISVLFLCLFLIPIHMPVLILALSAAWFSSINFGAFFHLASHAALPQSLGTFFGFINFLANLGTILFTLMFGWVKDATGSFSWGFGLMACLSFLSFLLGHGPLERHSSEPPRAFSAS